MVSPPSDDRVVASRNTTAERIVGVRLAALGQAAMPVHEGAYDARPDRRLRRCGGEGARIPNLSAPVAAGPSAPVSAATGRDPDRVALARTMPAAHVPLVNEPLA